MNSNSIYIYRQKENHIGYEFIDEDCRKMIKYAVDEIKLGDKVVIKPNFVRQCSMESKEWMHVITNPILIKEVLMAVINKLKNSGEVIILDAPQEDSNFVQIIKNTGLEQIVKDVQKNTKTPVSIIDIRVERKKTLNGIIVNRISQPGDPKGYKKVDLGIDSSFAEKKNMDYYGADYDRTEAKSYHNNIENSYVISGSVLECDVFINMPKWKTHKIGGMTCCLKNVVGIIGVKNCVPHHTLGCPNNGGDAYPEISGKSRAENRLKKMAHAMLNKNIPFIGYFIALCKYITVPFLGKPMQTIRSGHWYGNDTLWRAILDLNKIILYADKNGIMQPTKQRKYVSIIDGIVAGEKNGPMMPTPKKCGVVAFTKSPLIGDVVMASLMGFNYNYIPCIREGICLKKYILNDGVGINDIVIRSNDERWNKKWNTLKKEDVFCFEPAFGWKGHIEL